MPELTSQMIADRLPAITSWGPIRVVAVTGSTNADLAARARAGAAAGEVLVALEQTRGRGRRERSWASPPGGSISMSVLVEPKLALEQWGWLSLLAGVAVRDAIAVAAAEPGRVELKWPNDVLIDGGKVCGILAERVETPTGAKAVLGIGINLQLTVEQLPVPTATALNLAGISVEPAALVASVLAGIAQLQQLPLALLRQRYQAACASVGRQLTISAEGEAIAGRGLGIDETGRLLVQTAAGSKAFSVGDVVHASIVTKQSRSGE